MLFTFFVLAFSCFFDTSSTEEVPMMPMMPMKITMCVLDGMSEPMQRSDDPVFAQIDVVTCQLHEECTPIPFDVNIGKYGLGYILQLHPSVH